MTKYYVYTTENAGTYAFVIDPALFASTIFNPEKNGFANVLIEAENPGEAQKVLESPTEVEKVYSCEEPPETKIKRDAWLYARYIALEEIFIHLRLSVIDTILVQGLISIARELYELNPNTSVEKYLKKVVDTYEKKFRSQSKDAGDSKT